MRQTSKMVLWGLALVTVVSPLVANAQRGAVRKTVAILPFSSPTRWSAMGRNAQETFLTSLVKTKKVRVIEANLVRRMLRRRGLKWTGVVEPQLLKAAGRWLKADYLLAGKLRWSGDAYTLSAHVMDVRTLETSLAEDVDFSDVRKMRVAVRLMARKIADQLAGREGAEQSRHEMFLNVDARAFYDTADTCGRALERSLARYRFSGRVAAVDDQQRTVTARGAVDRLARGVPLDVLDTNAIDGPNRVVTLYTSKIGRGSVVGVYRQAPMEGVPLDGKVTSEGHQWVIAVATLQDEAGANEKLAERFRAALIERLSELEGLRVVEGPGFGARRRGIYRQLFSRGVEAVLEGKLYGEPGSRRAHLKLYSTMSGKPLEELRFETSL